MAQLRITHSVTEGDGNIRFFCTTQMENGQWLLFDFVADNLNLAATYQEAEQTNHQQSQKYSEELMSRDRDKDTQIGFHRHLP